MRSTTESTSTSPGVIFSRVTSSKPWSPSARPIWEPEIIPITSTSRRVVTS